MASDRDEAQALATALGIPWAVEALTQFRKDARSEALTEAAEAFSLASWPDGVEVARIRDRIYALRP